MLNAGEVDFKAAFPAALGADVALVEAEMKRFGAVSRSPGGVSPFALIVAGEEVHIPYRIYAAELPESVEESFSERQRMILWCLYSRHHDGRIREKALRKLLDAPCDFGAPFASQLLSEYVEEIGALGLTKMDAPFYREFLANNPEFSALMRARITSYWNEYYRGKYPEIDGYPPYQVWLKLRSGGNAKPLR